MIDEDGFAREMLVYEVVGRKLMFHSLCFDKRSGYTPSEAPDTSMKTWMKPNMASAERSILIVLL